MEEFLQKNEGCEKEIDMLRNRLSEYGAEVIDEPEKVLEIATDLFSSHPDTDIEKIVESFYESEREAADEADRLA